MSLTPLLQKHVLLAIIDEGLYLASKFGFKKGVDNLIALKDKLSKLTNDESVLKKTIEDEKTNVFDALEEVFGRFDYAKNLKHLFDSNDKELKKILKLDIKDIQRALTKHSQRTVKDFIKDELKVSKKYIREAQEIFTNKMQLFSVNFAAMAKPLAISPPDKPLNLYGVQINSLYKLIKILNGINNKELALQFLPFFEKETFNPDLVKAFIDAEKTTGFCRHPTLLVLIFESLTQKHPSFQKIISDFTKTLSTSPSTNGEHLVKNDSLTQKAFETLVEEILKLIGDFEPGLKIAAQTLANRKEAIKSLQTTQDIFLKTLFYFGCISPLLAGIEQNLPDSWPEQTAKMLRLELSFALDIVVGLQTPQSLEKIKARGVLCPALFELCTSTRLQLKAEQWFEPFIANEVLESVAESSRSHPTQPAANEEMTKKQIKFNIEEKETNEEDLPFSMQDIYSKQRVVTFYSGKKINPTRVHASQIFKDNQSSNEPADEATSCTTPEEASSLIHPQ
jgi:hypothetical protein